MSDDELDAELLALEGDESSAEEDNAPSSPPKREASEPKRSGEKSPPRRGVAQKLKARGRARKARQDQSDEEDAFGESEGDSPQPPPRMSSRTPNEPDDESPLYPIDGKFKSESDRASIMAMTEIEREEILAERAAEAQRRAQDQQLKRLLQSRRGDEDGKKRKAEDAELDDGQRKSSRQKTKTTDKIEAYKRQRELKGAARARGEEGRRKDRSPSQAGDFSDRDASGESDAVEWDDGRRASPLRKDDLPPELRDFERARVGRSQFAKYCFYPKFEERIKHCYVRVNVGMESSGPRYRFCQIKGFKHGRPYVFDGPNGKKIYTNQYVLASNGKDDKDYPFSACSDGRFTPHEFDEYRSTLERDGLRLATKRHLAIKCEDAAALIDHRFTDADIQTKIHKANNMRKGYNEFQRNRIIRRRDEAAARGDEATVARCNKDIVQYETGDPQARNVTPVKKGDQQSRLAEINKANRKSNSEEIRKALVAEKMALQRARAEAAIKAKEEEERKKAAEEEAAKNGGLKVPGDDLFGEGSDISRAGTPVNGTPKKGRSRSGTPLNGLREKKVFGQFTKRKMDDDVIASMDLGIDIDI